MLGSFLIVGDGDRRSEVSVALRRLGVDVSTQAFGVEVATEGTDCVVVRNAAGAVGLQQTFFAVRSVAGAMEQGRAVVVAILDIGLDDVDSGSLATLFDGLVKALPGPRLVLLSDRIDEGVRPTRGPVRRVATGDGAAVDGAAIARVVSELTGDSGWSSGHRLSLPGREPIR